MCQVTLTKNVVWEGSGGQTSDWERAPRASLRTAPVPRTKSWRRHCGEERGVRGCGRGMSGQLAD